MDGIPGAQDSVRHEHPGGVEERRVEVDLMQTGKLTASLRHGWGTTRLDGPNGQLAERLAALRTLRRHAGTPGFTPSLSRCGYITHMTANHFVYRLIPPRPTFAADMNDTEQAIMGEHAAYWTDLFERGEVVVFGVVLDREGAWGLAVLEAETEDDVRAIASNDPAVRTNMCTFEIGVMPDPSVRPR